MNNNGISSTSSIKIKAFHKDRLEGDMLHMLLLSAFYGMETAKLFNWSVEHRYGQLVQMQLMLRAGHSRMLYAEGNGGMPMGMLITTNTDKPNIKRMDAIYVFEPFRGRAVAQMLLAEARKGVELHSFAAPTAVEWHLKNGFRNLGEKASEGTFEMFTGDFKPVYEFTYAMPMKTQHDAEAIRQLEQMERSLRGKV